MKKLVKKDIEGSLDYKLNMNDAVQYSYFFRKVGDIVYKYERIGSGEWREVATPLKEEPYVCFSKP